jgi:phosphoglycerol transferase MdoB-like AlkP superfamily enzyme
MSNSQPNVIILGIDSLSPENLTEKSMPFVHQLLKKSVLFTNSISPLARTYPAWCSILTGLYTKNHHGDENLVSRHRVDSKKSIVWQLNQLGYYSVYATDDRRFNSLDKDFGFRKIIGPALGVNDVMLGSYNDFPLSNLLINFRLSEWLFPYNFSNRASYFSYYPASFSKKLERDLSTIPKAQPLFLAVHFTLPHWPYAYAESLANEVNNEFSIKGRTQLYNQALKRVDKQFQEFYYFIQQHGFFTNSLVIVLSDHGEALYVPNSRLTNHKNYQNKTKSRLAEYFKDKTNTVLDKSAGHGSDILSPKQYQNVLAFNIYKKGILVTGTNRIKTRVALIDLAPTILHFLDLPQKYKVDGISILSTIINPKYELPQRMFYIESGMYPNQGFSKEKAIELGRKIFIVNPHNKELELKSNALININEHKLYGIIKGNWILALYPDISSYIPVIQNLHSGQWVDDLNSNFAQSTPAVELKEELIKFYGKQIVLPIS